MRISVNLASRPFVELRPFFARLRMVMAGLAVLAVALFAVQRVENRKLLDAQSQMDALRNRTIAAQREKLNNEARMRQPANAAVLQRARFLNTLFLAKSFSWTAVMMDLENVLPSGVHVSAIEPAITTDGDVIIRLRVAGDRDRAVQLVRNLERSTRFLHPRLAAEVTQTKEQAATAAASGVPPGGVEFDIFANYNPLPGGVVNTSMRERTPHMAPQIVPGEDGGVNETPRARITWAGKRPRRSSADDGIVLKPFAGPRPNPPAGAGPTAPGAPR